MKSALVALALAFAPAALAQPSPGPQPLDPPAASPAAQDTPYPGLIRLDVDASDTARRIVRIKETIPVAGPGPLTLLYPQWLPGKHAPRGPIDKLAGLKITANGQPLAWTRDPVDVYAFHVEVPEGVQSLDLAFQYLSPTAAAQGRIEITAEIIDLWWSSLALYPAGHFTRQIMVEPRLRLPEGWGFGVALDRVSNHGGLTRFAPVSLETLIDSPVFAGQFYRRFDLDPGGRSSVRLNVVADTAEALAMTAKTLDAHRDLVRQADRLFGARPFDRYEFLLAISDRLGGIGLEHQRSSENQVASGYFTDFAKAVADRNTLPHEYTHAWNGKFRRPADLWTADFNTPMRNSLLWVYEGQTQYWGNVLGARSGMQSRQEVLDDLALTAATYENRIGRRWRTLADTTADPITAARRPQPWISWQRGEDYYAEGQLIWLDADTLIREHSKGKRSLDDFARAFFGGVDGDAAHKTYTFEDVVAALNAVEPYDWSGFLKARVEAVTPQAPLDGLARGGYRLIYTEAPTPYFTALETASKLTYLIYSLGLTINREGEITAVLWDGPAFEAGLTVSTKILAVNGLAYDPDRLKAAIAQAKDGKPIALIVKDGDHIGPVQIDYTGGLRYPKLERTQGPDLLTRILEPLK